MEFLNGTILNKLMTEQTPVCVKVIIKFSVRITFWLTENIVYWSHFARFCLTSAHSAWELESLFNHIHFTSPRVNVSNLK